MWFPNRGYSTTLPLLILHDHLLTQSENNLAIAAVFSDLSKAFNPVDHQILLNKLYHYGIRGVANDLFRSYLNNRKQFVFVNQQRSDPNTIKCGVPWGSTLGPMLFLISLMISQQQLNVSLTSSLTTPLCCCHIIIQLKLKLNLEVEKIQNWMNANKN